MPEQGPVEAADPSTSDWERQIRAQVSRLVEEISATPPSVSRASGAVSFEDVVGATARAVVPALLVDLPLELEKLLGRVLEGAGAPKAEDVPGDERVHLLRAIIARLSVEWATLAEKLVERLDEVTSRDPQVKARVHDRIAQQFQAGLLSTVVLGAAPARRDGSWNGGSPVLPADTLAERMAGFVARKVDDSISPLRSVLDQVVENAARWVLKDGPADPDRAVELRSVLRDELQEALGKVPAPSFRPEEIQLVASQIVHSLGASLTSMLFGPASFGREARAASAVKKPPKADRPRKAAPKRPTPPAAKRPAPKKPEARRVKARRR